MADRPRLAEGGRRLFGELYARLPDLLDELLGCQPLGAGGAPIPNAPGVYLFSRGSDALYIGQTRKLRQRMRNHRNPASGHNQASFAFLLAREAASQQAPIIDLARPRAVLMADAAFAGLFEAAKSEVRAMTLRFVEIHDPVLRTLFEVYAAVSLGTAYNDFETH